MIENASIVLKDRIMKGNLYWRDGRIERIVPAGSGEQAEDIGVRYDAQGGYVLPGLIDIHCDAIEKEVEPRPRTLLPMDFALRELEKKLAAFGITTMYHSLSLGVGLSLGGDHLLTELVDRIKTYRAKRAMIRHRIHLRYEISHLPGLPLAKRLIEDGAIDYLSFMNHAPGHGQYKSPGSFEAYVMKNQGVNREEVQAIIDNLRQRLHSIDRGGLDELAALAAANGIPLASHDDDSRDLIEDAVRIGMSVSEFPLNLATAEYARECGLRVCVGAPNVLRGKSHDNNMRAMDAIVTGAADIVCSDYLPQALLAAVFKLADESALTLPEAVNLATLHPAQALGTDVHNGSLEPGKDADFIVVEILDGYPHVRQTFTGGTNVYKTAFYKGK
jgi:alpha-D-ribose 1-methylphosphonate 5-triphosphate diphosphatase